MRIAILVTHIRPEEKLLIAAFQAQGVEPEVILDRDLDFDVVAGADQLAPNGVAWNEYDLVLERCVSTSRGLYAMAILNSWGIPTINRYETAAICADKLRTSIALAQHGVPQPATRVAFTPESAMQSIEELGYPAVLKPVTGSWGRLLAKVNGPQQAKALLEQKVTLGSYQHALFYVQEYQEKPGRDIRVFVVGDRVLAASYRSADHWITNTARGASSSKCPITPQIEEIVLHACGSVGARLAGVDLIETYDGYTVLEVNTGGEFHGLMTTTDVDIAGEIVDETMRIARASAMHRLETIATAGD